MLVIGWDRRHLPFRSMRRYAERYAVCRTNDVHRQQTKSDLNRSRNKATLEHRIAREKVVCVPNASQLRRLEPPRPFPRSWTGKHHPYPFPSGHDLTPLARQPLLMELSSAETGRKATTVSHVPTTSHKQTTPHLPIPCALPLIARLFLAHDRRRRTSCRSDDAWVCATRHFRG